MAEVTTNLETQKKSRDAGIELNNIIRVKINDEIEKFKLKEMEYKTCQEEYATKMKLLDVSLKKDMDLNLNTIISKMEKEKASYERVCDGIKIVTEKINTYVDKFDQIKVEMNENSKNMEQRQDDIETKKI